MPRSIEQQLDYLMCLPWTLVIETTPEGDRLLRVREIPSAVGCGTTDAELESDFWESLREALRAYLHFGDEVPQPERLRGRQMLGARPVAVREKSPELESVQTGAVAGAWGLATNAA